MRILWASDAPWAPSGYGVQTALAAPRLAALGHDVALLATFGLHGTQQEWQGLKVYPGGLDPFANDVIGRAARDWQADIVITLKDVFVFRPDAFAGLRWCPLIPVDHEPAPPAVIDTARYAYAPIAYAPNGVRALLDAGLDPLYAPHGYDADVFKPQDRAELRKKLAGLPEDAFIVGTVAVNRGDIPSRKAWPQNLDGFAAFAKRHSEARYFIHTHLGDDGAEGAVNISLKCAQLGIMDRLLFCDQEIYRTGFPAEYMAWYYNSIDVLLATSAGEGFGIPQLEAQACGTPIIASEFAAARDLCWSGVFVEDDPNDRQLFYDRQGSYIFLPEPQAIKYGLERVWKMRSKPEEYAELQAQAIAGAAPYAIDTVVREHWEPLLTRLAARIADEPRQRHVTRMVHPEEVLS